MRESCVHVVHGLAGWPWKTAMLAWLLISVPPASAKRGMVGIGDEPTVPAKRGMVGIGDEPTVMSGMETKRPPPFGTGDEATRLFVGSGVALMPPL